MTFTYSDALTADRDKVRLRIGDTQSGAGPRPDRRNFTDEEIAFILDEEGDVINAAIAHSFEILAAEWTSYALSEREGEAQFDAKETADKFEARAKQWRAKPGGASETEGSSFLIAFERDDAYTSTSEYAT